MGVMNVDLGSRAGVPRASLERLPVNLFGSVMGIAGLALAWRLAGPVLGMQTRLGEAIGAVAVIVFLLLGLSYLGKAFRHADAVAAEFCHPVSGNFFGTITIGILLLSSVLTPWHAALGQGMWIIGMLSTFLLSYVVVRRLLAGRVAAENAVPAWLIPGVAALDIAVTGATMPFAWAYEVNLIGLALGAALAVVLFVLIAARLIHREPMPLAMTPSLMVLVAPFEVGFLGYVNVMGGIDMFAGALFWFGLFLFLVLAPKVFRSDVPFSTGWWAISFPLAALVIASLRYAGAQQTWPLQAIAAILLFALTLAIAVLFIRTLVIVFNGKLLRG